MFLGTSSVSNYNPLNTPDQQQTESSSRAVQSDASNKTNVRDSEVRGAGGVQAFYGILVQHFVRAAEESPPALRHLDALTQPLLAATAEVPFYAATVARARLDRAHHRLAAALKDPGCRSPPRPALPRPGLPRPTPPQTRPA